MLSQRKWTLTVHVLVYLTSSRRWMEIIIFLIFDVYKETMVIWSINKFTCNRHWVTAGPTGCRLKKADPVVTRWEMRVLLTPLPFLVNENKTSNLPSSPSCMWSWPSIQLGNIKYHHTNEFFCYPICQCLWPDYVCEHLSSLPCTAHGACHTMVKGQRCFSFFFNIKIFRWSLTKCSLRFKMKSCF